MWSLLNIEELQFYQCTSCRYCTDVCLVKKKTRIHFFCKKTTNHKQMFSFFYLKGVLNGGTQKVGFGGRENSYFLIYIYIRDILGKNIY